MKTSKECRQIAPILETVLDGNATEQEIQSVEIHTATCAACHAEYQRWQQTANLVANWRTAAVPESTCNWSDLHARLTTPQSNKLRPIPSLRMGLGGVAGALAIGIFCLFALRPTPPLTNESAAIGKATISGLETNAVSENPALKMPPAETQLSVARTRVADPTVTLKTETPPLTLVKSDEPNLPSPREERAKRGSRSAARGKRPLLAQTQSKSQVAPPRRVILAVDGETMTPERDDRYTLGAVPGSPASSEEMPRYVAGGAISEHSLTHVSYSSPEAKTAW